MDENVNKLLKASKSFEAITEIRNLGEDLLKRANTTLNDILSTILTI